LVDLRRAQREKVQWLPRQMKVETRNKDMDVAEEEGGAEMVLENMRW
jgi:hypothetical protein